MKKKLICGALLISMLAATFTSCGGSSSSGSTGNNGGDAAQGEAYTPNPDEEPYNVKFLYLLAQEGDHYDDIKAAVNEQCLKDINMTVEFIPVTYGTMDTTLNMMLPAGEALDVFTTWGSNSSTYLDSGYIRNWADYEQNLPDVKEWLGDNINCCYIGDTWVVIPSNYERCAWTSFLVRNDILQELGHDVSEYEGIDVTDFSSFDKLTELFAEVKAAHPEMTVINGTMAMGMQNACYVDGLSDGFGVLENYGQTTTVTNWYESEQWKQICELNKVWYDAGYASADIVTNQDSIEPLLKAGNLFCGICNAKPNTKAEKLSQCAQDIEVIKISSTMLYTGNFTNGFSLASASEDPAKAAAWYNWAFTSQEFNDLINWGIEGVDWVENDQGLATYPEGKDATSVGYHNDYGWIYPNQMVVHAWEGNDPDVWDSYIEFNKGDYVSKGHGFRYNNAPVIDQVVACTAVQDQYRKSRVYGAVADIDATIAEFNEKLYAAGLQDIIDEKQRQLDEFLAAKG